MKACLVNASYPRYNFGLAKYRAWLIECGWQVEVSTAVPGPLLAPLYDLVAVSAIFSWDVPKLVAGVRQIAERTHVEVGGPGCFALTSYIERATGVVPCHGLDERFDQQAPLDGESYRQVFTGRGCPGNCCFCIVSRLEGMTFVPYANWSLAPVILDNNILAASVEHQERVIERLLSAGYGPGQVDFNSGFDPVRLDQAAINRFGRLSLGTWRLAFDEISEESQVRKAMRLLRANKLKPRQIRVYVLFGNEAPEICHHRARKVIEWGGEPFVQPMVALNALERRPVVRHGWTLQRLRDASRYYNRFVWRSASWRDYNRNYRQGRGKTGAQQQPFPFLPLL